MSDPSPLTIDIVSDVVCPWCYLGKANLEKALAEYNEPVIVRWHPFQLDPTIPPEGLDRKAYMAKKFPDPSYLKNAHERLKSLGDAAGLKFDFESIAKSPNTLDAHRLIQWAEDPDQQDKIVTALFKAYFEQGRDIGDKALLTEIAVEIGFERQDIEQRLSGKDDIDSVKAEIEEAQRIGVTGVPFFIFNRKLAASGAQPPEQLLAAMRQAQA
ncbi:MAG: DsbA family oxidoreductase [Alphaproteobacteria bacterium]